MKRLLQTTLLVFVFTGLSTVALAQSNPATGQIGASAEVSAALTVTPGGDLLFGTIAPGATSDIITTNADAGDFTVSGNGSNVTLSFSAANGFVLQGPGGATMSITTDGTDAGWSNDSDPNNIVGSWDPNGGSVTGVDIAADADNTIYVFIGGSITAGANQTAGTYTETITLTAEHI